MTDAPQTERLETGWFADTPTDDTLLRRTCSRTAEWMESVARWRPAGRCCAPTTCSRSTSTRHTCCSTRASCSDRSSPDRAETVAADLMQFFTATAAPSRSSARGRRSCPGFDSAGHPPLMLRVPGGERPATPSELTIEQATTREALGEYEQVLVDGFPLEPLQPWHPGVVFHPGQPARSRARGSSSAGSTAAPSPPPRRSWGAG